MSFFSALRIFISISLLYNSELFQFTMLAVV